MPNPCTQLKQHIRFWHNDGRQQILASLHCEAQRFQLLHKHEGYVETVDTIPSFTDTRYVTGFLTCFILHSADAQFYVTSSCSHSHHLTPMYTICFSTGKLQEWKLDLDTIGKDCASESVARNSLYCLCGVVRVLVGPQTTTHATTERRRTDITTRHPQQLHINTTKSCGRVQFCVSFKYVPNRRTSHQVLRGAILLLKVVGNKQNWSQ